jgi:HAD superfamily hydrolase (TIGR01493 family)
MIKVIAFDLFGTVLDPKDIPREEIKDYISQVRRKVWEPLKLLDHWSKVPLFEDSREGLKRLNKKYKLVTCSNFPYDLQIDILSQDWKGLYDMGTAILFSDFMDFEKVKAYKPDPKTYSLVYQTTGYQPYECLMVTGNEGSPDLEGAKSVGMQSIGIRNAGDCKDIIELAEILGC